MVMIAVDNFFKTIWHHRAYYLTPPFFLCVCGKLYIFFLSSSPAEKATLHFSLTMYKSKGRQKKLPPTYTHRKKKKKTPTPTYAFLSRLFSRVRPANIVDNQTPHNKQI